MATPKHKNHLSSSMLLFFFFFFSFFQIALSGNSDLRNDSLTLVSCEDLRGIGSLNTTCQLNYNLNLTSGVNITGTGSLFVLQGVTLTCPILGCKILVNITGKFRLSANAQILAGSVVIDSGNLTLSEGSVINVTAMGGEPAIASTGTPNSAQGGGGGYGGRGASCLVDNRRLPEQEWGGDAYGWDTLDEPKSFGSRGDTTNYSEDYGGKGGGRIWLRAATAVRALGMLLADGGDGGNTGGGGSGGSICVIGTKM